MEIIIVVLIIISIINCKIYRFKACNHKNGKTYQYTHIPPAFDTDLCLKESYKIKTYCSKCGKILN